jgi:hypothetical protein
MIIWFEEFSESSISFKFYLYVYDLDLECMKYKELIYSYYDLTEIFINYNKTKILLNGVFNDSIEKNLMKVLYRKNDYNEFILGYNIKIGNNNKILALYYNYLFTEKFSFDICNNQILNRFDKDSIFSNLIHKDDSITKICYYDTKNSSGKICHYIIDNVNKIDNVDKKSCNNSKDEFKKLQDERDELQQSLKEAQTLIDELRKIKNNLEKDNRKLNKKLNKLELEKLSNSGVK